MSKLLETLVGELQRSRKVSSQVANYIVGTYNVEFEGIGEFLTGRMPELEDYEHDLILSPLFTPKLTDQAIFADLLGPEAVPKSEWPGLVAELAARRTAAQLVTSDGKAHAVALRDVVLERYVHRLRLDAAIPASLLALVREALPEDIAMLQAVARRAIWESEGRRAILEHYLASGGSAGAGLSGAMALLDLMESYKPADRGDLLERIPRWTETLREEIRGSGGPRPFLNAQIHASHGGERDQRTRDDVRISIKQAELAFLEDLQQKLA